jgi:hypothetical protein
MRTFSADSSADCACASCRRMSASSWPAVSFAAAASDVAASARRCACRSGVQGVQVVLTCVGLVQ